MIAAYNYEANAQVSIRDVMILTFRTDTEYFFDIISKLTNYTDSYRWLPHGDALVTGYSFDLLTTEDYKLGFCAGLRHRCCSYT
jgi:hypothetical protein